ncbi:hypothetical protein KAR91_35465 [Candidatus Pacearchaeota archaeon]|nr:hypothetical protein [Candidatus Pacearchaeota archaeon]
MILPSGLILVWSGAIVDIPAGFVLCNGANGTPDLRNRFVVGAGDTYSVDDTGGTVNHTHTGTTDGHTHEHESGSDLRDGAHVAKFVSDEVDTFTTNPTDNLPPYYALAFIMKT